MAEGILGLGAGQAATLNQDLIDKLKGAERKARVEPIEKNLEKIVKEREVFSNIEAKVKEVWEAIKPFDLFVSGGTTAFDQKAATISGDSATFDAINPTKLKEGSTSVDVKSLAQKDVYQSDIIKEDKLDSIGTLTINGKDFDTSKFSSYTDLAKAIDKEEGMAASFEKIGDAGYRLIVKSEQSGVENKLNISGIDSLGFGEEANHVQKAQNMEAEVDGVTYSVPTNKLEVDNLNIVANKVGVSSITIANDKTQLEGQMQNFVTKFNELISMIDKETGDATSPLSNKSGIRNIVTQIKDKMFGSYGEKGDKSIFNMGIELNKNGTVKFDSKQFKEQIENDLDGLKDFFVGSAAKEGFGTQLKATIDEMSFSGGILNTYDKTMNTRESSLKEDKEKAEEDLKTKYKELAMQFGSYGAIINQFEASFSGMKMMIQQSIASK